MTKKPVDKRYVKSALYQAGFTCGRREYRYAFQILLRLVMYLLERAEFDEGTDIQDLINELDSDVFEVGQAGQDGAADD